VSDDLAAFLSARLDEDEAAAREGQPDPADPQTGEWTAYGHHPTLQDRRQDRDVQMVGAETELTGWMVCTVGQFDRAPFIAAHIARHDPARVLREVKAGRAILALHTGQHECPGDEGYAWYGDDEAPWCPAVRHHAAVYDDHPDYRQEWKP
jgi:hypothetical protein